MIIDEIYELSTNARRYDEYVMMCCVFHDDRNPSLMVHNDNYYCLSCGAKGATEKLLLRLGSKFIIPQKETTVSNPFWGWSRKGSLSFILKSAYQALKTYPQQGKYLQNRGLTQETIQKAKLGFSDGFYTLPILDIHQNPVGALARAGSSISGARYFVPSGQNPDLLYSPDWQMVNDSKEVFLTFGTIDSLSIYQCGKATISTTSGKRVRPEWFKDIRKKIKVFADFGEEKEAKKLIAGLGWRGSLVKYRYPQGLKDPSDLIQHGLLKGIL